MEEAYVLPSYWWLKIDKDNIDLIQEWRLKEFNFTDDISNYNYVWSDGLEGGGRGGVGEWLGSAITTEQFIQYVIKESPQSIIDEDYNYLTELLQKLNIR